jgi:hypothetical protein
LSIGRYLGRNVADWGSAVNDEENPTLDPGMLNDYR